MASSIGYLSSTEPSSPIGAEKTSRMCSITDMSTSIASPEEEEDDGVGTVIPVVEELAKYFPTLDTELTDACRVLENDKLESDVFTLKDPELESIRSITPISISSGISTPLATKGSATIADLTTDDDEEATLSVDTCLSLPIASEIPLTPSPTPSLPPMTTNRVQKQISLYESELVSAQEFKTIVIPKKLPDYRKRFYATDSNSLLQSSSNDSISLMKLSSGGSMSSSASSSKTKSCMNLKSCISVTAPPPQQQRHHPGAIVVKEKFIDVPKRITSNFRGHTRCGSVDERKLSENVRMSRKSDSIATLSNHGSIRLRFVSTRVTEDGKDNKVD